MAFLYIAADRAYAPAAGRPFRQVQESFSDPQEENMCIHKLPRSGGWKGQSDHSHGFMFSPFNSDETREFKRNHQTNVWPSNCWPATIDSSCTVCMRVLPVPSRAVPTWHFHPRDKPNNRTCVVAIKMNSSNPEYEPTCSIYLPQQTANYALLLVLVPTPYNSLS